jgi:tetratricopeptide (TPR) repeat protein
VEGRTPLEFGQTARHLARNPLGIIALFIVLIYGTAGLVFGLAGAQFDTSQKWALILFLVLFPTLVFFGFVWLVAKHSHRLYAPSDFRNEASFVELNKKVSVIEVRQQAAEVDPRGDSDSAFTALEGLVKVDQIEVAKNLAKAFLKVKRYEVSLRMFDRLIRELGDARRVSLMQYRAYSLVGLARYEEALQELDRLRLIGGEKGYDFWPRLAVAYCYLKLGQKAEFESALRSAVGLQGSSEYGEMVAAIYPEMAGRFADILIKNGREPEEGRASL